MNLPFALPENQAWAMLFIITQASSVGYSHLSVSPLDARRVRWWPGLAHSDHSPPPALNQRGDHGHVVQSLKCSKVAKGPDHREIAHKFTAHSALGYDAANNTEYLIDDCLYIFNCTSNWTSKSSVVYCLLVHVVYKYQTYPPNSRFHFNWYITFGFECIVYM